jgi:hypothetical protein
LFDVLFNPYNILIQDIIKNSRKNFQESLLNNLLNTFINYLTKTFKIMSTNAVNDALKNAFLQSTISDETQIAVKAEDLPQGGGIDFSQHFFEPQIGSSYLVKLLPNPGGNPIEHRSVYKNLPDPERRGKTFHYVSSGNAKTCKALELFFELHALKKEGDAVAEKKIEKYLSRTNQGCVKVQILHSPKPEEIGMIRMMSFSTFGPNATVANLIDKKLNPTKEQQAAGFEREDIFNIFGTSVISLVCTEATYDGVKGRDFTKSDWAPKKRGAIAVIGEGADVKTHEFKETDLENGQLKPEVVPFFNAFIEKVLHPDYDVRRYFSYKEIDDARNDKDTNDYLKSVQAKVDEITVVIREKSLTEIAAYGKKDTSAATGSSEKESKTKNVLAESVPDELSGSVMAAAGNAKTSETKTEPQVETKAAEASASDDVNEDDVLNA